MEIPTPEEFRKKREEEETSKFNDAVALIVGKIQKEYTGYGPLDIDIPIFSLSEGIIQRIVSAFQKKGWSLYLEPPKGTSSFYKARIQANPTPGN